ncbi:hypothetical protein [Clostridium tertium]|uniref:Uncharacterized protein n=1 Tax=Clostridium tertium TaxID=1559 RepID=A0A6N3E8Q3_9CLOT
MKYIKNLPSTNKKISEELISGGWTRLKEPSSISKTILFSFPLMIINLHFILKLFGLLNGFTIALCVINAMGSSVDCLNILLILKQVPKNSYIVSNGSETYFKKKYCG